MNWDDILEATKKAINHLIDDGVVDSKCKVTVFEGIKKDVLNFSIQTN